MESALVIGRRERAAVLPLMHANICKSVIFWGSRRKGKEQTYGARSASLS